MVLLQMEHDLFLDSFRIIIRIYYNEFESRRTIWNPGFVFTVNILKLINCDILLFEAISAFNPIQRHSRQCP